MKKIRKIQDILIEGNLLKNEEKTGIINASQ